MGTENDVKESKEAIKEATKQAMAEIKAEKLAEKEAKDAKELDVKEMVKEILAAKEVDKVEVKKVKSTVTKDVKFEVKEAGYSRHNYTSHVGYKDTELDQAYDDGMWYKATIMGDIIAKEYCENRGIITKELTSLTDSSGGYTVPEQLLNRIIVISNSYGVIQNRTDKFTATTGTMLIPKNGADTSATFTLENITKSESDPGFDQVEVTIKKLAIATIIPMELIQDSVINIISYVVGRQAWAIAKKIDEVGFYGDGTAGSGSMTGIIPAIEAVNDQPSIINPITNDGTWASVILDDFNAVMGRLNETAWEAGDVAWYCSNGFYNNSMNKVKGTAGGNNIADLQTGFKKQFLGYEVVTSSVFPATDQATPSVGEDYCLFGSLKTVLAFASRMGNTIKSTSEGKTLVLANQTLLVSELRFGLTVHDQGDTNGNAGSMILLQS